MNLFQSPEWEQFKLATGWQKSHRVDDILILQKSLPLGRTMLYSPMVDEPELVRIMNKESRIKDSVVSEILKIGKSNKAIFYRLELDVPAHNSSFPEGTLELGITHNSLFKKSFEEMQPEHTIVLDIDKSDDEILGQMKPKGRYNIKVAGKYNLEVRKEQDSKNFFNLYSTMANRQKITYRSQQYFQNLVDILGQKDYCELLTAFTEDSTPLASIIVSFYGNRATYLFGGSSNEQREKMAPYLLQWTAIKMAKERGCTEYDFFGTAPNDDPNHPWAGVTRYKKQFGGHEVCLLGSWDLVLRPIEYQIFKIAEKLRRS